jgi:tRNA (guanine37-N1)-methyltransferase
MILVCGRYEGFDDRIRGFVDEEISLGDFVMTGGEVGAMAVIEATVRLLPGVLGNEASTREESHGESGLLEYPQFTRPAEFRGLAVPEVLVNGNHAHIAAWRSAQARERTLARRPDLIARLEERSSSSVRGTTDDPRGGERSPLRGSPLVPLALEYQRSPRDDKAR